MDKNSVIDAQTGEIVLVSQSFLAPAIGIQEALIAYQAKKDLIDHIMKLNLDYGTIPGTEKPTLYKAGAEKATSFFGLHPIFTDAEVVNDWTGESHGGEPFFFYRRTCSLYRGDVLIASVDGSCNSWEKKYRYRSAERKCPECGKTTIIKGKAEYGGGYLCWAKKGGCGAKFLEQDIRITGQSLEQVCNPDIDDVVNTVLKMADKRALVAAVLIACGLSEYFSQDADDFITTEVVDASESTSVKVKIEPAPKKVDVDPVPEPPEEPPVIDNVPVDVPASQPIAVSPEVSRAKADWVNAAIAKGILKDTKDSEGAKRLISVLGEAYATLNTANSATNRAQGLTAIANWKPA